MPGGRPRLREAQGLIEVGKLDARHLITHRFDGFEHVEDALRSRKDKPADPPPVVNIGK